MNKIEMVGNRFGRLVVVKEAKKRGRRIYWECKCDCGSISIVEGCDLRNTHTQSCGCLRIKGMVGQRFGKLLVIDEFGRNNGGEVLWKCQCDCGNISIVRGCSLRKGVTKSCGCLIREANTTHGMSNTPTYRTWDGMLQRCNNPNYDGYKNWGGRGITVCNRWLRFERFFEDMGLRPKDLTIERKDNELGYFKENCLWANYIQQGRNQRIQKRNKTMVKGVYFERKKQRYQVYIRVNRKQIYIGGFTNLETATIARHNAELKYWGNHENL